MSWACNVIDPPWAEYGGGGRGAQNHYPLMHTPEIVNTILGCPLWSPANDSLLWLWTTDNYLRHALGVVEALGFDYKRTLAWVKCDDGKLQIGLGQYLRGSHELCLVAGRGRSRKLVSKTLPSVLIAPRTEHSRKPDEFYRRLEDSTAGPRLELFARRERAGWTPWGNEIAA